MSRRFSIVLVLLTLAACKGREQAADTPPPPADSLTVVDSFKTPESVLYDSVMDVYLVSNINGTPLDKDDNGFISRVGTDGRVVELHWVDGASDSVTLHAPKGMGIHGDTLFVADINVVRMFDRTTGRPLGELAVAGSTFLNDVDVGPDGTTYVTDTGMNADFSDSGTEALYARAGGGAFRKFSRRGMDLGAPNGIVGDGSGGAYVNSFASGEVYHVTAQGERHMLAKPPEGGLDGLLVFSGGNRLIATSWNDSSVIALDSGATAWRVMFSGLPNPADIGYDSRRQRVLVPLFQDNRVEIRKVR